MSKDSIPIRPVDGSDAPKDAPIMVNPNNLMGFTITVENPPNDNRKAFVVLLVILTVTFLMGVMIQAQFHLV